MQQLCIFFHTIHPYGSCVSSCLLPCPILSPFSFTSLHYVPSMYGSFCFATDTSSELSGAIYSNNDALVTRAVRGIRTIFPPISKASIFSLLLPHCQHHLSHLPILSLQTSSRESWNKFLKPQLSQLGKQKLPDPAILGALQSFKNSKSNKNE